LPATDTQIPLREDILKILTTKMGERQFTESHDKIFSQESFLSLTSDQMKFILSSDWFRPSKEEVVWDAVLKWAKHSDPMDYATFIQPILPYIRFPLLDVKFFDDEIVALDILESRDVTHIYRLMLAVTRNEATDDLHPRFDVQKRSMFCGFCFVQL